MPQRKRGTCIEPYIPNEIGSLEQENVCIVQPSQSLPSCQGSSESAPLLINTVRSTNLISGYGSVPHSTSWSTREGIHPYTRENRPNRRPFHLAPARRVSIEQDASVYSRFRYYSRLRAPVVSLDDVLVIPDHIIPIDYFMPFIPGHKKDGDGKQESYVTIIAIWNTMMGTSILTMPWSFGQAGFFGGLSIMVSLCGVCFYTSYRLLTLQKTMGLSLPSDSHEIGYLCRILWDGPTGKAIEGIAVTFSVITLLGAQVVYWVLMSNFLFNTGQAIHDASTSAFANNTLPMAELLCPSNVTQTVLDTVATDDAFSYYWRQDLSVPIILLIPFIFLLSIKNLTVFTYFNSCGAISVVVIYVFVIVKAFKWGFNFNLTNPADPMYIPPIKNKAMALSGTLSLAYFIHNCIITIMKGNRHQKNNVRDLCIAFGLVAFTYIPIAFIYYTTFPLPKDCVEPNFLDNFPSHNPALTVVRSFLLFQMLSVFPLLALFLRSQLLAFFLGPECPHTNLQIAGINGFVLTICVLTAIFYPNVGFIIRWIGAIAGLVYIFVLPCLTYMKALHMKGELTWKVIVPHTLIMLLGVANFISQFFLS